MSKLIELTLLLPDRHQKVYYNTNSIISIKKYGANTLVTLTEFKESVLKENTTRYHYREIEVLEDIETIRLLINH